MTYYISKIKYDNGKHYYKVYQMIAGELWDETLAVSRETGLTLTKDQNFLVDDYPTSVVLNHLSEKGYNVKEVI